MRPSSFGGRHGGHSREQFFEEAFCGGRFAHRGGPRGGHFGRGPGGPGGGGPGMFDRMADFAKMRGGRVLSSEHLQLLMLALVEEKPRHGYEIIKELSERSSGIYKPSPGMIYPALQYLEEADFVSSAVEANKKLVSITAQGKAHLDENREHVTRVLEHLKAYGERMSYFKEQMSGDQDAEDFRDLMHGLRSVIREKFSANLDEKKRVFDILKKAIDDIRKGK